jgi:hypothetical protein
MAPIIVGRAQCWCAQWEDDGNGTLEFNRDQGCDPAQWIADLNLDHLSRLGCDKTIYAK